MIDDVERWADLDPPDDEDPLDSFSDEEISLMMTEPEFQPLADCPGDCSDYERHVMGCPHGPDWDLPNDWEPDFGAESGRERHEKEYTTKYQGGTR